MASILTFRMLDRRIPSALADNGGDAEIIVFPRTRVWEIFGAAAEPSAASDGDDRAPSPADIH